VSGRRGVALQIWQHLCVTSRLRGVKDASPESAKLIPIDVGRPEVRDLVVLVPASTGREVDLLSLEVLGVAVYLRKKGLALADRDDAVEQAVDYRHRPPGCARLPDCLFGAPEAQIRASGKAREAPSDLLEIRGQRGRERCQCAEEPRPELVADPPAELVLQVERCRIQPSRWDEWLQPKGDRDREATHRHTQQTNVSCIDFRAKLSVRVVDCVVPRAEHVQGIVPAPGSARARRRGRGAVVPEVGEEDGEAHGAEHVGDYLDGPIVEVRVLAMENDNARSPLVVHRQPPCSELNNFLAILALPRAKRHQLPIKPAIEQGHVYDERIVLHGRVQAATREGQRFRQVRRRPRSAACPLLGAEFAAAIVSTARTAISTKPN